MPFSLTNTQGGLTVTLEGALTIRHAQELAARLREDLKDGMAVEVKSGGVEDIDTSVLQILCSLRKTAPSFTCDSPSEAFTGAVERCSLKRELLGTREDL